MVSDIEENIKEIENLRTKDTVLSQIEERIKTILENLQKVKKIKGLKIFIINFSKASDKLQKSDCFTDSCKVFLIDYIIIINENFLLELETALRSFDLAGSFLSCQYLTKDEDLFGLIKRIRKDQNRYLNRLRKFEQNILDKDQTIENTINELTLLTLFFISHEIGHLIDRKDVRSYTSFINPDAPLETKIANAVIKLCKHADDFKKYGFGLPDAISAVEKDSDIRKVANEFLNDEEISRLNLNHTLWYKDEISADEKGIEIVNNSLDFLSEKNQLPVEFFQYLMIKALFVAAIYSWYKDLLIFCEKIEIRKFIDTRSLTLKMAENRERYIKVASLFGSDHRFTLLRAQQAIDFILEKRSGFNFLKNNEKTIWYLKEQLDSPWDEKNLIKWRHSECLQRYFLLCILMDTAVKFAYIGCATGWIKKIDQERKSPQLLFMTFESIGEAVKRLYTFK